jgi:hypothetical protein
MEIAKSLGSQSIDGGGFGIRATVTTHPRDAVVLTGDPEDVGFLGGRNNREDIEQKEENFHGWVAALRSRTGPSIMIWGDLAHSDLSTKAPD